jgi:hypothetical protein
VQRNLALRMVVSQEFVDRAFRPDQGGIKYLRLLACRLAP